MKIQASDEADPRNDFAIASDLQRIEHLRSDIVNLQEHAETSKVLERFKAVEEVDKLEDARDAILDERVQFQKMATLLTGLLED